MENQSLFFISIIPPKEAYDIIKGHQKTMSKKFDSHKSYGHIPHITLVPPFRIDENKEDLLKTVLSKIDQKDSFDICIDGFSHFKKHTVFAEVVPSDELYELQQIVLKGLNSTPDLLLKKINYFQKFRPHITIAYKDIEPNFKSAWQYFEDLIIKEIFRYNGFSLLKYDGEKWSVV